MRLNLDFFDISWYDKHKGDDTMAEVEFIDGFALGYAQNASAVPQNDYHCDDTYEIFYLRRGSRECFVKDTKYYVTPGHILFIDKNVLHKTNRTSEEYERFVLNFTDDYIFPSVREKISDIFEQGIFAPPKTKHIDTLFFNIFTEWEKMRKNSEHSIARDMIKCYVNLLFVHFIENKESYASRDAAITNPAIERLVKYMNNNFSEQITLNQAAHMLNMSMAHLSRIFVKNTGFGFAEYLHIIRMEQAKKLLANTEKSIKQISYECGFNDSNYFSSVFKRKTEISPLQYRKNNIG